LGIGIWDCGFAKWPGTGLRGSPLDLITRLLGHLITLNGSHCETSLEAPLRSNLSQTCTWVTKICRRPTDEPLLRQVRRRLSNPNSQFPSPIYSRHRQVPGIWVTNEAWPPIPVRTLNLKTMPHFSDSSNTLDKARSLSGYPIILDSRHSSGVTPLTWLSEASHSIVKTTPPRTSS